jgi:hypothetical protein
MPELIEVLTPSLAKCPAFVVNNAVDYVAAVVPGGPQTMQNPGVNTKFIAGDSFRLLSIGITFPESFTFWKNPVLSDDAFGYLLIAPFGVVAHDLYYYPNLPGGMFYVPMENYETILDVYFDCRLAINSLHPGQTLLSEKYTLECLFGTSMLQVSMQGAPAAMNGKTFRLVPFIKIMHNFNLT